MEVTYLIGAIIAGVVLAQLIGMLWYSRIMFAKIWMKAINKDEMLIKMEREKGMTKTIIGSVLAWTVVTFLVVMYASVNPGLFISEAFTRTAVAVVGLAAIGTIPSYLYEGRSMLSWIIYFGYFFIVVFLQLVLFTQVFF